MKKLFLYAAILFSLGISAQSQYEKGMEKAFSFWKEGKITEASNLFERIANADKKNWIPAYYVAYVNIISSFGIKEEAALQAKLDKAKLHLDKADELSSNNPEIMIMQALRNTAFIAFDGQKYGMSLSMKNSEIFAKAIELAPNNPRVILQKAEWDMGSARFFGKPIEPYCKDIKRALELAEKEEKKENFEPSWGKSRAEQILKQSCSK